MADLDQLQIEIKAESANADKAITNLCSKLGTLSGKLNSLNTGKFTQNINEVTSSLQALSGVKFNGISSLSKNVTALGNMDISKIQQSKVAILNLADSLKTLDKLQLSDNIKDIAGVSNAIAKLGNASAKMSVNNIDKMKVAISEMMISFSKLPKINESVVRMAEATAKFSRTGRTGTQAALGLGKAFDTLGKNLRGIPSTVAKVPKAFAKLPGQLKGVTNSINKAVYGFRNMRTSILSAMGVVGGLYGLVQGVRASIDYASQLKEVQNVIDVSFGKYRDGIEDFAKSSIKNFGISALSAKKTAGVFQSMGMAAGIARGKMADMSVKLTELSADMASFYDRDQLDVAKALQSVLTGTTKPLRQYGIDLTQATVQEWAMKHGMEANMRTMTQAEKIMLRYNYVLSASKAAQGDFIRTQGRDNTCLAA